MKVFQTGLIKGLASTEPVSVRDKELIDLLLDARNSCFTGKQ
eukprot:CAMPEP_0202702296 /NCGR_PEP_ID=MMETSP1385-20130828/15309_1 /ASSEMBLY_ACC=CAM_ASM_000861 /TAXON_ID=933848 /ORGANISM="Elphidium margaritaceum" /LENGTH=41 /DNA_ID= /DNA_START= /DNA_END= /DNA_ORIENTATION=